MITSSILLVGTSKSSSVQEGKIMRISRRQVPARMKISKSGLNNFEEARASLDYKEFYKLRFADLLERQPTSPWKSSL
jgi:hypothetical protein